MRIIGVLFAIILLAACTDKNRVPSDILSRDKMEDVIWDLVQAEQYSSIYVSKDTPRIDLRTVDLHLYQKIFLMHQISKDEFSKSLRYYEDRPELLRTVFDSLLSRGNRQRSESYRQSVITPTPAPVVNKPVVPAVVTPYSPHGQATPNHGQGPPSLGQAAANTPAVKDSTKSRRRSTGKILTGKDATRHPKP